MEEGKLLGHIISKDGIRIDPARVQEIQQIDLPQNKKEIQSFNGKMNFLRCFVPNIAEHLREITNMLKKEIQVRWMEEAVKSFNFFKLALSLAPVLVSPDYTQDFILFTFASEHAMAAMLLQKRDDHERPIAFFNRAIRDVASKYNFIEKQALALVKALKYFRVYILHSHILAYVPNVVVKDVLVQIDPEGRRGKWIAALLEYGVEIKPTNLVKGQGLAKLMAESNLHALDINLIVGMSDENEEGASIQKLLEINKKSWHKRLVNALWADWVNQKKSIGTSPFKLIYGVDIVFPTSLIAPIVKLIQEVGSEDDPLQRRLNQMVHLQQTREEVFQNTSKLQEKIKKIYDRKEKADKF
eukprot:PITA_01883